MMPLQWYKIHITQRCCKLQHLFNDQQNHHCEAAQKDSTKSLAKYLEAFNILNNNIK
jgi:REP element-mobilizing transposase RayT